MRATTLPLRNLGIHRLRSVLTAVGIAAALASLLALVGLSRGVDRSISMSLENHGTHLLALKKGAIEVLTATLDESLAGRLRAVPGVINVMAGLGDFVELSSGEMAYMAGGKARRMVITYHSDIVRQKGLLRVYAPFLRRVLQRADRIMPTNQRYVETSRFLHPFAAKCTVVPLGIDLDRFAAVDSADVQAIQRRYGQPLVIFVGRLRYYKGLQYLIQAMVTVPARLLVVGTGPMAKTWQDLATRLDIASKVIFLGDISDADLPAYLHASSVFVLPSSQRSEAFGVSMLEGMACGLPAVSTELGTGTSFVNQDGQTGIVVPPSDATALSAAIGSLLSNAELRQSMGQAAHDRAWGHFSSTAMVDQIMAVYEGVLAG